MAFMTKDGFRLYYEDTGGNAPTILFLHGAGGHGRSNDGPACAISWVASLPSSTAPAS